MSKPRVHLPPSQAASGRARQLYAVTGVRLRDERIRRRWSLRQLAHRSGLSLTRIQAIESGAAGSVDAYVRLATALGLRLEVTLADPSSKAPAATRTVDLVHSAMGELEAAHFRGLGFSVGIDEPYQHFQFAGRADVVVWDRQRRALLHIENRTRNLDFQAAAGAYNAKRAYLGQAIADRLQISRLRSETHVLAALWSSEMLHAIRLRTDSFRSICPDPPSVFEGWWRGDPPSDGRTSTLIALDPAATARRQSWIDFDEALTARPRHRGYADAAAALRRITDS